MCTYGSSSYSRHAIDYNEWKFGNREEGTVYSLHSFFRKLAQGVGPSAGLMVATMLGYDAALKADQTAQVASNMRLLTGGSYLVSALMMFISIAIIFNLDQKTLAKMNAELEERRSK